MAPTRVKTKARKAKTMEARIAKSDEGKDEEKRLLSSRAGRKNRQTKPWSGSEPQSTALFLYLAMAGLPRAKPVVIN
jgi:hypothetical protein